MGTAFSYFLVGCVLVLALVAAPVAALVSVPPLADAPVLVVAWPWVDAAALVQYAGGTVLGGATAPLGLLASSESSGFIHRLQDMPGVILIDGRGVAHICGVA